MKEFEYDVLGFGTPEGTYPGQFTPTVIHLIKQRVEGCSKILHLFSGSSNIGHTRVDLTHPHATHNMDVFEFLSQNKEIWDYVILDPPYEMSDRTKEEMAYKGGSSNLIAVSPTHRHLFNDWCKCHAKRVLWLDVCAPLLDGFNRIKVWFLLPGGYRHVRVLSELKNDSLGEVHKSSLDKYL